VIYPVYIDRRMDTDMPTRFIIAARLVPVRLGATALLAGILLQPLAAAAAPSADAVAGSWATPNDKSHVLIERQADGTYAGKIIWLKQPDYPAGFEDPALSGKPKVDRHNPTPSLRDRPILGLDVLREFRYQPAQNNWDKGTCYDPEGGKTYNCKMWLTDAGRKLYVRGYVWIFHKTQVWTRLPGN
jgi:uncharacterized protein (DUF2147 family)